MKVVLSHAHAEYAQGATDQHGWAEWPLSVKVNQLTKELLTCDPEIEVVLVDPGSGVYRKHLSDTVKEINESNADIAIECHFNGHKNKNANGFEVLYYDGSNNGRQLALEMFDQFRANLPIRPRGIVPVKHIYFLRATKCPSVILEPGFITNFHDEEFIASEAGQEIIANCMAKAILDYKRYHKKRGG